MRVDETRAQLAVVHAELQRRLEQLNGWLRALAERVDSAATKSELAAACTQLQLDVAAMRSELVATSLQIEARIADETRSLGDRVDRIFPPPLADTLEVPGDPIVALARQRAGVAPETPFAAIDRSTRYAMFESVFYESAAVAEKQRVYLRYLDQQSSRALPFLDLGCGRGEFLRILASAGVRAVGVDENPASFPALRSEGFEVVEDDVLAFLERGAGRYAGISLLQVAEHLTREQIDRLLALAVRRIASGGVFILETPNPLSPLALSVFHTDPTHVAPLPPEAMRYAIEAAGFERTRTLFQGRIPGDPFAGPDPRAYYVDYAIIATRGNAA
jgi:O-antigen chain-terminating methyltransferase